MVEDRVLSTQAARDVCTSVDTRPLFGASTDSAIEVWTTIADIMTNMQEFTRRLLVKVCFGQTGFCI